MTLGGVEPAVSRLRVEWPTVSRQRRGGPPRNRAAPFPICSRSRSPELRTLVQRSRRTPWESNPAFCPLNRRMPTPVRRGVRVGSGGRSRTFARLIQSQSGSPERARRRSGGRIRTVFDSFKDCPAASARRSDSECGARIELASLAWKARAHTTRPTARGAVGRSRTCTQPVKSRLLTTERRRQ